MGKYTEFSIESALNTKPVEKGYKLEGMKKFAGITANPSRSTEEFISGAISCLGQADRAIMYTTMSLEALNDRLALAAKIAAPVNQAKSRGVEGFKNVPYLNPWEYAIEGKVGEFMNKIWQAIKTICRKILEAIQNFIRFIGNAISNIGTKKQAKDYDLFVNNQKTIMAKAKAAKIDQMEMNSLPWKVDGSKIASKIENFSKQYIKVTKPNEEEKILVTASNVDMRMLNSEEDILKVFSSIFGLAGIGGGIGQKIGSKLTGSNFALQQAKSKVQKIVDRINNDITDGAKVLDGQTNQIKNPHELVTNALVKDNKAVKVKIGSFNTKEFGVLSNEWLSSNVTKVVAGVHAAEKTFNKFTATIDKICSKFEKLSGANKGAEGSLSKTLADLSKARCNLNNFYNGVMIELTSYALRYRKTLHIALKAYIHAGYGTPKAEKKNSKESLQSIESMFAFD